MSENHYLEDELYRLIKTDDQIFNFLQESSLDGLWYWDLENPEVEWMNPSFWTTLGYDPTQMPHKSSAWQSIIHPEDLKLSVMNFQKHCEDPSVPYDQTVRYAHKNGTTVWIRCRGLAIRDIDGNVIRMLGAHQNVTAYKESELLMQDHFDLLQNTQKMSKLGSWKYLLKTDKMTWSEELYDIFKLDKSLAPPKLSKLTDLFLVEDGVRLVQKLNLALEQGISFELELRTLPIHGQTKVILSRAEAIFDNENNIIGLRGMSQDISTARHLEQNLATSNSILLAVNQLHEIFIDDKSSEDVFEKALQLILTITNSDYGFIGEVLYTPDKVPYLKTKAITNIAWNDATRQFYEENAPVGLEFTNLKTLFGKVLSSGEPMIANEPSRHPDRGGLPEGHPPLNAFLGLPILVGSKMIGMLGVSNRPSGYDQKLISEITPITNTLGHLISAEKVKQSLHQSEQRLQLAIEGLGDGLWDWDLSTDHMQFSSVFEQTLGYIQGELISHKKSFFDLIHPDEKSQVEQAFFNYTQGKVGGFGSELRLKCKNGEYKWFLCRAKIIARNSDGHPTQMIAINSDISNQKSKEAEIVAITKEIQDITNAVNENSLVSITNIRGEIISANRKFCELSGYSEEELLGNNHRVINSGFHPKEFWKEMWRTISNGNTWKGQIKNKAKDGREYWVSSVIKPLLNDKGIPNRYLAIRQDITDRKNYEEARKESELRLSLATQAGGVGVWDFDLINNTLTWDKQMFVLYGISKEDFTNAYEAWAQGVYEPDRARGTLEIEAAIRGEKDFNTEFRVQKPNGEIRNIRALATVVKDEDGTPIRMIGTNWDITREKEVIQEVERAKEAAEKASKSKSEFLANMSHEIRTPLNGVIGFTELLKNTPLTPVQQQYVQSAHISGHTLLGIINDILDFSKIEAGMLELDLVKTDMLELFENSLDIVKFAAEAKGVELLLDISSQMPQFAEVDSVRIKQILANLLGNAVKFTAEGEVGLKVEFDESESGMGIFRISVSDTGIGISEEQISKLFKSFSQADSSTTRKFGGTGLGLVISQMIAEKMGSEIHISSHVGEGTTFFFEFTTRVERGDVIDISQVDHIKRCLLIEDNLTNNTILKNFLQTWGIEVDTSENGFEALKKMETSECYDLIICDYDLPYMNGLEVLRMMKDKLGFDIQNQKVVLLQSSTKSIDLDQKCEELGVELRLNKPVKLMDLFNKISRVDVDNTTFEGTQVELVKPVIGSNEKVKVLVADDVSLNLILIKAILKHLVDNVEILEAKNGIEAIEVYQSAKPDIILMDVQMPELDGLDATRQIRELEAHLDQRTPIIALTAGALKEQREQCLVIGMDDFLTKPIDSDKLRKILEEHLF